jgi:hypothetical protein
MPRIFKFRGGITVRSVQHYAVYMQQNLSPSQTYQERRTTRKKTDKVYSIYDIIFIDYVQMK